MIQIGQKRDLPISEVANEWMSFSSSKHLQLNYDNIENFSLWVCYLCNKFSGTHTHTHTHMDVLDGSMPLPQRGVARSITLLCGYF